MNYRKSRTKNIRSFKGSSLIELMVSVFIFAIGVLGFASLQSRSIQATFDNTQRDQVVWLTESLIDRIRLNVAGATDYVTELDDFERDDCALPAVQCDTAVCTSTQMATFDVWDLYCRNNTQGVFAIKGFTGDLTCTDADTDGNCDVGANFTMESTWCARTVETTNLDTTVTSANDCDKTIAQMRYQMDFRP